MYILLTIYASKLGPQDYDPEIASTKTWHAGVVQK